MSAGIRLLIGLGNPGPQYADHRHNVGAWFIESLSESAETPLKPESKLFGSTAKIMFDGCPVRLFVPNTFMNDSGKAALAIAHFYNIPPQQVLVAHDELDFEPGKARLKKGGGHGGHNGLRDIHSRLGSDDYYRLRIGIGHPGHKDRVSKYVLSRPSISDQQAIERSLNDALTVIHPLVQGEFERAFHQLHSH